MILYERGEKSKAPAVRHHQPAAPSGRDPATDLQAAQELFTLDGYVTTTIAAIADHTGVAVQTVYASAKSKRDILKGILDLSISGEESKYRSRPARDGVRSKPNLTPGPS